MSDNASFACLVFSIAAILMCSSVCSSICGVKREKELTARQSQQAVENNFKLAYELWAEDRPKPVQAFPDWKKEHTMELDRGVFVVKLKDDTSGDAVGDEQK